mmetsp:Transcript_45602/g.126011  ORF Transcript_45602/g.126011 Transcript_45602/m.126011 type:complete len:203 (+) Transcript_45602:1220-1828(+)
MCVGQHEQRGGVATRAPPAAVALPSTTRRGRAVRGQQRLRDWEVRDDGGLGAPVLGEDAGVQQGDAPNDTLAAVRIRQWQWLECAVAFNPHWKVPWHPHASACPRNLGISMRSDMRGPRRNHWRERRCGRCGLGASPRTWDTPGLPATDPQSASPARQSPRLRSSSATSQPTPSAGVMARLSSLFHGTDSVAADAASTAMGR